MGKLITNQDRLLSNVISNILPSAKNLDFLIGYFYFSGFEEIYKGIENKKVRILVGMDIEQDIKNKVKEFEYINAINQSRGKIRENYYNMFIEFFNKTNFFDTKKKQEAFKIYLDKIKNGSLEVRKTVQPNHAKLYLFENKDSHNNNGDFPGILITGSSNLSRMGLKGRAEINVELRDSVDFLEGKKIFDELWNRSIKLISDDNFGEFERKVVKKIWFEKLFSPYLIYLRVLEEVFGKKDEQEIIFPEEITENLYINLKYQTDAIKDSMEILERHGGVIISDVVGLGKSIIASTIAYNLRIQTIVIAPPHLVDQWKDYKREFDFKGEIYSSGSIEKALINYKSGKEKLIIIDEAHKYRNESTKNYVNLHQLCQGNKVVLLTATPFNNRPEDIFSMIKLFQIPARSTIQTVYNLTQEFKELVKEYKDIQKKQREKIETPEIIKKRIEKLAEQIRELLFPLLIRRTRIDLDYIKKYKDDLEIQGIQFPEVEPPRNLEYNLVELKDIYLETLEVIAPDDENMGFQGTRYKPVIYLKNFMKYKERIEKEFSDEQLFRQSQINIAKFMRRLLVARFESSIFSFRKSLDYMIKSSEIMLDWYESAKLVPIFKKGYIPDVESLKEDIESDFLSEEFSEILFGNEIKKLEEKGFHFIPANELKISFKSDLEKDISLLKSIREKWEEIKDETDPKIDHFYNIVKESFKKEPERKIVVFTSYNDTAEYLKDRLKDKLKLIKYGSKDATRENKLKIKYNFDAGIPSDKMRDDYDILIATDAISEGFNLHRAGTIFNYDIPYNPTRVIQRVGRINRINKKVFDKLYIYNFFPTDIGESETGIKRISTLKKAMIDALLGEDTKILTSDEELNSYFADKYINAEKDSDKLSWDAPFLDELEKIKILKPDLIKKALTIPERTRIRRGVKKEYRGVILFGKKGKDTVFKLGLNDKDILNLKIGEALKLFFADPFEQSEKVSDKFENIYKNVENKLFQRSSQIEMDKGKRDTLKNLNHLLKSIPEHKDYLEDLIYVVEKLDGLIEYHKKFIRTLNINHVEESLEKIKDEISHEYLIGIIDKAGRIEDAREMLILSEELI